MAKTPKRSPEVMRRRLRLAVRQAREAADLTQKEAAARLYWSVSKLIRVEQGLVLISPTDLRGLLSAYGVTDEGRVEELVDLAVGAREQSWDEYKGVYSPEALALFGNEEASSFISKYEPTYIPGLLQTPEYAFSLLKGLGKSDDDARLMVEARVARQQLLREPDHPQITFVLGEGAVLCEVGGQGVMVGQFERLNQINSLPGISIRILPFSAGAHPRMADAFTIMEFPGDELDDLLYLENAGRETTTREDQKLIAEYRGDFLGLEAMAIPSTDLSEFLAKIVTDRFGGHQ
jgi:transcriptional regulator with XRE-family HTH domain